MVCEPDITIIVNTIIAKVEPETNCPSKNISDCVYNTSAQKRLRQIIIFLFILICFKNKFWWQIVIFKISFLLVRLFLCLIGLIYFT
jgi:hypothetical protein